MTNIDIKRLSSTFSKEKQQIKSQNIIKWTVYRY